MTTQSKLNSLISKLKKQVKSLEKNEIKTRRQLHLALKKMRKMGDGYKNELATKVRVISDKMNTAHFAAYHKAAVDIEKQLKKIAQEKITAVALALAKVEKKHATLLTKQFGKKVKKVKNRRVMKK